MVKCQRYMGEPTSNAASQPFKLQVHSNVLLLCDFHSHLASTEIIGIFFVYFH